MSWSLGGRTAHACPVDQPAASARCRPSRPDTCQPKILAHLGLLGVELVRGQEELAAAGALPPWLGNATALHRSHQSALLRKDPDFCS